MATQQSPRAEQQAEGRPHQRQAGKPLNYAGRFDDMVAALLSPPPPPTAATNDEDSDEVRPAVLG